MSKCRKRKPSSPRICERCGRMSSRRTSEASRAVTCFSSRASASTAPRWKTSPSIAARLEHPPLRRLELIETSSEQRMESRRNGDLVASLRGSSPASP